MTDLVRSEDTQLVKRVSQLDREFQQGIQMIHTAWVLLSETAYELHEERAWEVLGYDTLNAWLAEPERGLQRRQFFRLVELWREFVVTREVSAPTLEGIDHTKLSEVLPAIRAGRVSVDEALEDARSMGFRDLREQYSLNGVSHDPDPAEIHDCPVCGKSHRGAKA